MPILYAGICSDGIAYTLQIIAQKTTDATVASIIMSLESVFAALGGWLILSESLAPAELGGCALVFAAVILSQVPDFIEAKARPRMMRRHEPERPRNWRCFGFICATAAENSRTCTAKRGRWRICAGKGRSFPPQNAAWPAAWPAAWAAAWPAA